MHVRFMQMAYVPGGYGKKCMFMFLCLYLTIIYIYIKTIEPIAIPIAIEPIVIETIAKEPIEIIEIEIRGAIEPITKKFVVK